MSADNLSFTIFFLFCYPKGFAGIFFPVVPRFYFHFSLNHAHSSFLFFQSTLFLLFVTMTRDEHVLDIHMKLIVTTSHYNAQVPFLAERPMPSSKSHKVIV